VAVIAVIAATAAAAATRLHGGGLRNIVFMVLSRVRTLPGQAARFAVSVEVENALAVVGANP